MNTKQKMINLNLCQCQYSSADDIDHLIKNVYDFESNIDDILNIFQNTDIAKDGDNTDYVRLSEIGYDVWHLKAFGNLPYKGYFTHNEKQIYSKFIN